MATAWDLIMHQAVMTCLPGCGSTSACIILICHVAISLLLLCIYIILLGLSILLYAHLLYAYCCFIVTYLTPDPMMSFFRVLFLCVYIVWSVVFFFFFFYRPKKVP